MTAFADTLTAAIKTALDNAVGATDKEAAAREIAEAIETALISGNCKTNVTSGSSAGQYNLVTS